MTMSIDNLFSLKILLLITSISLITFFSNLLPQQILSICAACAVIYAAAMNSAKYVVEGNVPGSLSSFTIWLLPIAATAALVGIYTYILSFGMILFNEIKSIYIILTGVVCAFSTFRPLFFSSILGDICCVILMAIVAIQLYYNSACGTILFTVVFSYQGICQLPISSFQNAFLICFFMFLMEICEYSEMQVSDLTGHFNVGNNKFLEKVSLFGKDIHWNNTHDGLQSFALKDIILPGLFVAQMLRFDLFKADNTRILGQNRGGLLWTPYFYASFICLFAGFCLHNLVSTMEDKTLPTFLFTFPSCVCTTVLFSIARREFVDLIKFSDNNGMDFRAKKM